jgi:PAS domain S-box-containing protein
VRAEITALRHEGGRLRGFSKITRDMTERKQAEENARRLLEEEAARRFAEEHAVAMWEQRERLRVTLHSIGDGVIATDAAGRVTLLNPVAEALTGWSEQTGAYGQPFATVFHIINEHSRLPVENPVARVLREGGIVGLANHTILVSRDGTERPIDDSAAPIKNARGETIGVVLVFRDGTERRRVEQELREADRRKTEFLATLSHELRNPLAPIRLGLQALRLENEPQDRERTREMMDRQVTQMVRLVDDLLDVSRITRNRLELRKTHVALASVIENAVETARPLIESKGHTLTVTLPPEPLDLEADLTRLAQVFWNLLNNSAKYTDRGGRITLTAERQGREVLVAVKDNGIGIPPEARPGLFAMFSQVDRSLKRSQGGLGIGLALVKGLVEMHGGSVQARSPGFGRGSEFLVRLPLARPERSGRSRRRVGPGRALSGGVSWSWTTTGTPPPSSPGCCRCRATRRARPTTAWKRWRWPRRSGLRWCCWTSACRSSTATTPAAASASSRGARRRSSWPSPAGARRTTTTARRQPGSTTTWSSRSTSRPWPACWRPSPGQPTQGRDMPTKLPLFSRASAHRNDPRSGLS